MNRAWKIFLPFAVSLLALNRTFSRLPVIKTQTLELLGESHGPIPVLPRTMSGCATVLASWHRLGFETVKSEDGSGVYFEQQVGDDLYPVPPARAADVRRPDARETNRVVEDRVANAGRHHPDHPTGL
jgi:hypothetical protein